MISRTVKAAFYTVAGPMMRINGSIYRKTRAPQSGIKAQLGPGPKRYLPGWTNVDANMFTGKCDVWADLRNPLPFREGSVVALYSHHVIEHLPDLRGHFAEAFRALAPGGVYRVAGPNGDNAIHKFVEGDSGWFNNNPENRRSIGGRFENFIFCKGEHLTILTESFLREIMEDAGFAEIALRQPIVETGYPDLFTDAMAMEHEKTPECPHTLVLEAIKPA